MENFRIKSNSIIRTNKGMITFINHKFILKYLLQFSVQWMSLLVVMVIALAWREGATKGLIVTIRVMKAIAIY